MIFIRRKDIFMSNPKYYRTTISLQVATVKQLRKIASSLDIGTSVLLRQVISSWVEGDYTPELLYQPDRIKIPMAHINNITFNVRYGDLLSIAEFTEKTDTEIKNKNRFCRSIVHAFLCDWEKSRLRYIPAIFRSK